MHLQLLVITSMLVTKHGYLTDTTFTDSSTGESVEVMKVKNRQYTDGEVFVLIDWYNGVKILEETVPV